MQTFVLMYVVRLQIEKHRIINIYRPYSQLAIVYVAPLAES